MRILQRAEGGAGWLESVLDEALAQAGAGLAPADRGLVRELVCGVVRWQATLDWLIDRRTGGRPQKPSVQRLLRLGLYQLFWLDRVPDHAAVHETVEMARRLGGAPQAGFVNAILRGCLRERAAIEESLRDLRVRQPHLGWSHPEWLCARWAARWGADGLARLLEWDNTPPPTYARVNTLRASPEALAAQLEREGVLFTPRPYDWVATDLVFELREHPPLPSLPSFRQGLFYVQDPSTLLAPRLLDPQPGQDVLDLCAAPGGKTTYLAQLMGDRGCVVARDSDPERLRRVTENCARLQVACVRVGEGPGPGAMPTSFDRILVDAPCSNTGVMRRRVELRWRVRPGELERLAALQLDLLRAAVPQLRPGGALVYSTCSLEPEENGDVVRRFLAEAPGFRLEAERQLVPLADKVDGAYAARLVKAGP
ncbi:MAG: hypothetical protein RJA22_68 [Verrucomicrobiota bacterium]